MKSYTDLEQSKKLAEILPLESADMWWSRCTITDFGNGVLKVSYAVEPCNISQFRNTKEDIPCWSLAALLDVLPFPVLYMEMLGGIILWCCECHFMETDEVVKIEHYNDSIDACYEMIIKLHELNLL